MSQTVTRALSIVKFFAETPRTLGEVADHLAVHKSTALRLLQTLEAEGFARQQADGRYTVGFLMVSIGQRSLDDLEIRGIARPHLLQLSEQYGHTIHLAQLINDDVVYVDKVDGRGAVNMHSRVGRPAELHTAGVAKAILANVDDDLRRTILKRATYQRYTSTTLTTPSELSAELETIALRGWAEDNAEFEDYLGCIAAPIRNARGQVFAAVSITALRALASREALAEYVPELLKTAAAISAELGWLGAAT